MNEYPNLYEEYREKIAGILKKLPAATLDDKRTALLSHFKNPDKRHGKKWEIWRFECEEALGEKLVVIRPLAVRVEKGRVICEWCADVALAAGSPAGCPMCYAVRRQLAGEREALA